MEKIEKVQKTAEVEVVKDITCNMCGGSCQVHQDPDIFCFVTFDFNEALNKYGSTLLDFTCIEGKVHFCDTCTVKLLASLKICPVILWDGYEEVPTKEGTLEFTPEAAEQMKERNEAFKRAEKTWKERRKKS